MTTAKIIENLVPNSFVSGVVNQRRLVFLAVHGEIPFLLIRLDDQTGELLAGLSTSTDRSRSSLTEDRSQKQDGLGFHTVALAQNEAKEGKGRTGLTNAGSRTTIDTSALRKRILTFSHFVAPLNKQAEGATYKDRISIGRARNMDIVLRNGSISKFHAWVERDSKGDFSVADTGSKNGTTIKGRSAGVRTPIKIHPGDEIMFGSVSATFCPADVLWDLIHDE